MCDEAVHQAIHVVAKMLEHSPLQIMQLLLEAKASVAIIGRDQVVTGAWVWACMGAEALDMFFLFRFFFGGAAIKHV